MNQNEENVSTWKWFLKMYLNYFFTYRQHDLLALSEDIFEHLAHRYHQKKRPRPLSHRFQIINLHSSFRKHNKNVQNIQKLLFHSVRVFIFSFRGKVTGNYRIFLMIKISFVQGFLYSEQSPVFPKIWKSILELEWIWLSPRRLRFFDESPASQSARRSDDSSSPLTRAERKFLPRINEPFNRLKFN